MPAASAVAPVEAPKLMKPVEFVQVAEA
jgi:hypothetical protein